MNPTILALSLRAAFGPIPGDGLHSAGWIWFLPGGVLTERIPKAWFWPNGRMTTAAP